MPTDVTPNAVTPNAVTPNDGPAKDVPANELPAIAVPAIEVFTIDPDAALPPYDQLKQSVLAAVESGSLAPGTKLPTVRALAADLGLAPNTVARAYRELEALGVLDTRGRSGTFVAGDGVRRAARQAAADYLQTMAGLGFSADDAIALLDQVR